VELEREVEKQQERDAVSEYVMMSDDDSDTGGSDVEVCLMLICTAHSFNHVLFHAISPRECSRM
jgi:hypothetical protein